MLFAEITWADVGMEFVKFLFYLVGTCSAFYITYRQMKPAIETGNRQSARAAEFGNANAQVLKSVKTDIAANTAITEGVAKAVNGGHKCNFMDPSQTISSRLNTFQLAMVEEIKSLKETVGMQTTKIEAQMAEIVELKRQIAERG